MNTSSRTTLLLLLSALSFPNVVWCWDDSSANYSSYDRSTRGFRSDSNDNYRNERHHEKRESPEELEYRAKATALQQYYQTVTEQKAEVLRLQTEYLLEKQRMETEAQLRGLQK